MSSYSRLLRNAKASLSESLVSRFRELVFDNRYALHPRRLAQLGAELSETFLAFMEESGKTDPVETGRSLAQEGVGSRTILAIAVALRGFCRQQLAGDPGALGQALDAAEQFCSRCMEGFIAMQEALILKDQDQLRRALSSALEEQSRDLLVKNHAVNTSINGIMLTDLDGKVTWVNASFLALWGYASAPEVIGMPITAFWAEEEARRVLESLLSTGGWRGELVARRKDKTNFSVDLSASAIRNEEGAAIGIMTSFVDATERKRLQAQVIQAQKMEALGQLAGGITHDFNNLLTVIAGFLRLLLDEAPRDSRMRSDLIQIQAAVDRGTALTKQLRLFTRQTAGIRAVVSLNDVIRETREILRHTFPPQIGILLDLDPALDMIEADPNQLSQVLMNLCVNARDSMTETGTPRDGSALSVATTNVSLAEERVGRYATARPGAYVSMRVKDTGTGIAREIQDRLFVPFMTTKGERNGTGLGLAVVYGIVTSHQGFIDVHSVKGEGTEFELLFPRTLRSRETATTVTHAELARGHGTVLVVDDEQQIREVMSRVLTECGYNVISAEDGGEALDKFGNGDGIDLVILDVVMPGLGGRECLARLRELKSDIRVLVATGYTSDGSAQEMIKMGALAIIEKPLDLRSFARSVQRHVSATT